MLKKYLLLTIIGLLTCSSALAATRYNPYTNKQDFTGVDTQNADCSTFVTEGYTCWDNDNNVLYIGDGAAANAVGGGSGAPTDATYITQTANGDLSAEQALGSLSTGVVTVTTTTGVLSSVAPSTSGNVLTSNGTAWTSATPSAAGDITAVGDCATGAAFGGACGNTVTFDTNGGASGVDAIITQDQTNNWIDLKAGGFVDSGSTYEPVVRISNIGTNGNAIAYFDPNNGSASLYVGASHSGYGHIIHHTGAATNVGTGLMFYNKVVYPSYTSGTEAALRDGAFGDLSVDDIITLGASGKRFQQLWLSDELIVGSDLGGRANIDGQADEVQLWVQGHSTQTNEILLVEASDGTDNFKINNAGEVYVRDMNTGGNAGTDVCIDANNRLCACGTCA